MRKRKPTFKKATVNVHEMAKIIGIGLTKAYALASSSKFYPAFRIGRKVLVNRDLLEQWRHEQSYNKSNHNNNNLE